jgi:hypothetical protein
MARVAAALLVRHLTPEQLSERLQVPMPTLAYWRKNGIGPNYIRGESAGTKATVRYPLAEVEAWELSRLVTHAGA